MQKMPNGMSQNNGRTNRGNYARNIPAKHSRPVQSNYRNNVVQPHMPVRRQQITEHIRPINSAYSRSRVVQTPVKKVQHSAKKKKQYTDRSKFSDFLFGFVIGLIIFGIAAIVICNALIGLIT